jgi:hypothetical protein
MEYRPYYLAREWTNVGYKVAIIAISFSHLRSEKFEVNRSMDEKFIMNSVKKLLKRFRYDK